EIEDSETDSDFEDQYDTPTLPVASAIAIQGSELIESICVSATGFKAPLYLCRPLFESMGLNNLDPGNYAIKVNFNGETVLAITKSQLRRLFMKKSRQFVTVFLDKTMTPVVARVVLALQGLVSTTYSASITAAPEAELPSHSPEREEIGTVSNLRSKVREYQNAKRLALQQLSRVQTRLVTYQSVIPTALFKLFVKIRNLDSDDKDHDERFQIITALAKALVTERYHSGVWNYRFVMTQFKYASLNNIKGMAAHYASDPDVREFLDEFVSVCGVSSYNFLRGNGFDTDAQGNYIVSESCGPFFLPDPRTIQNDILDKKEANNTFGLLDERIRDIVSLCKLQTQQVEKEGGVISFGHLTDETDKGNDDVEDRIIRGRLQIFGLCDYGGIEEDPDCPFVLIKGVAKSKRELENILNNHITLIRAIKNELNDGHQMFQPDSAGQWILNLINSTQPHFERLALIVQDSIKNIQKQIEISKKKLSQKAVATGTENIHGNAALALERKQAQLDQLVSFESAYVSMKPLLCELHDQLIQLKVKPLIAAFLADNSNEIINLIEQAARLFLVTTLAIAPRGDSLELHMIGDSHNLGAHIAFSFLASSQNASMCRYIDNFVYDTFEKEGLLLSWKVADGLTIGHTINEGRTRPTTATCVYKNCLIEFHNLIKSDPRVVSATSNKSKVMKSIKVDYFKQHWREYLNVISEWKFSTSNCPLLLPKRFEVVATMIAGNNTVPPPKKEEWIRVRNELLSSVVDEPSLVLLNNILNSQQNLEIQGLECKNSSGTKLWLEYLLVICEACAASIVGILSAKEVEEWNLQIYFILTLKRYKDAGVDFFSNLYVPEIRNGKPYVSFYDFQHWEKRFTTAVSLYGWQNELAIVVAENGFSDILPKPIIDDVLDSGETVLNKKEFFNRDKQHVYDAKEFWSESVEAAVDRRGLKSGAEFIRIVREAGEAWDNKGLTDNMREIRLSRLEAVLKAKCLPAFYSQPPSSTVQLNPWSKRKQDRTDGEGRENGIPYAQMVNIISTLEGLRVLLDSLKQEQQVLLAGKEVPVDIPIINHRGLTSNPVESKFSIFRQKEGHTATGRVNSTPSFTATHAAHMLSLREQYIVKRRIQGKRPGYSPYSKSATTYMFYPVTKDI
ncbi:hypothetical protein HDU79_011930, partial [Rhizoclosmatium sp. JEL0117]